MKEILDKKNKDQFWLSLSEQIIQTDKYCIKEPEKVFHIEEEEKVPGDNFKSNNIDDEVNSPASDYFEIDENSPKLNYQIGPNKKLSVPAQMNDMIQQNIFGLDENDKGNLSDDDID